MKNTIRNAGLLILSTISVLFAEDKEPSKASFYYTTLGIGPVPAPVPNLGLGYRFRIENNGIDSSLVFSTFGSDFNNLDLKMNTIHYFNDGDSMYLAAGFRTGICRLSSEFYDEGATTIQADGRKESVGAVIKSLEVGYTMHLSPEVGFGYQYKTDSDTFRFVELTADCPTFNMLSLKAVAIPSVNVKYGWGF